MTQGNSENDKYRFNTAFLTGSDYFRYPNIIKSITEHCLAEMIKPIVSANFLINTHMAQNNFVTICHKKSSTATKFSDWIRNEEVKLKNMILLYWLIKMNCPSGRRKYRKLILMKPTKWQWFCLFSISIFTVKILPEQIFRLPKILWKWKKSQRWSRRITKINSRMKSIIRI